MPGEHRAAAGARSGSGAKPALEAPAPSARAWRHRCPQGSDFERRWLGVSADMLNGWDEPLLWGLAIRAWLLQGAETPGMWMAPCGGTKWQGTGPPPRLSLAGRGYTSLLNRIPGEPKPCATCLWESPCSFQVVSQGLHIAVSAVGFVHPAAAARCSPSRSGGLFSFPQKMEEHQRRKKPAEVPHYINSPVGSMTKVLLCC